MTGNGTGVCVLHYTAHRNQHAYQCYQASYKHRPGKIHDVFNRTHYQTLLKTIFPNYNENNLFFYFSNPHDIAIGISTDGFVPFKQHRQTCWPIIAIIYNLAPKLHFLKLHHLDLFGVKAWDASTMSYFILWAYLILLFGDIPAIALLMCMKGPNHTSLC